MTTYRQRLKQTFGYLFSGLSFDTVYYSRRNLHYGYVILSFHKIVTEPYFRPQMTLARDVFAGLLDYLHSRYEILSLEQLAEHDVDTPHDAIKIVLTFDDGYRDNYTNAYPELKIRRLPATIFLSTGYIGSQRILWWDLIDGIVRNYTSFSLADRAIIDAFIFNLLKVQRAEIRPVNNLTNVLVNKIKTISTHDRTIIEEQVLPLYHSIKNTHGNRLMLDWSEVVEMSGDMINFGGHTVNHPNLDDISTATLEYELMQCKQAIENKIARPVTTFAYPSGRHSATMYPLLHKHGYRLACTTNSGLYQPSKENIYCIPRIDITTQSVSVDGVNFSPALWNYQLFKNIQ
ncbi:MAG: polysaccharide deacetylase family protein [Gammaproteobacteria bacterium]|nr:polysaccharide deacetylase family protein [Gammaproteobacteria bacterium]